MYVFYSLNIRYKLLNSLATLASCSCSQNEVVIHSRIVRGESVVSHSWTWAISLDVLNEVHFCGKAILSPEYILIAAYCVNDSEIMDFALKATVGRDTLLDKNTQRLPVSHVFVHPHWMPRTNDNGIDILKLKNPLDFNDSNIAKICFSSINELAATEFSMPKSSHGNTARHLRFLDK